MDRLLIIGCALDGPINEIVNPRSLDDVVTLFGGKYSQSIAVTPSATAVTLDYEPLSLISQGFDEPTTQLYSPTISGSICYFGNIGGSGTVNCKFVYQPYLGKSDLIAAVQHIFNSTGSLPAILRSGGSPASLTVQGWSFESRHLGPRGNSISVAISGSTLTITGPLPEFDPVSYTVSGQASLVAKKINDDYELLLSPVRVTAYGTTALTAFTSSLSSGTSGGITTEFLQTILDQGLASHISTVVVLSEFVSGYLENIVTYNLDNFNNPKTFFFPSLSWSGSGYLTDLTTAYPSRSGWVGLINGNSDIDLFGSIRERYLVESVIPEFVANPKYSPTNFGLKVNNFSPRLSADWLENLYTAGVMAPVRVIGEGPSIYKAIMSDGSSRFYDRYSSSTILAIGKEYLSQFMAVKRSFGRQPDLEKELTSLLTPQFEIDDVTITVLDGFYDYNDRSKQSIIGPGRVGLICNIAYRVYDEIHTISFNLRMH